MKLVTIEKGFVYCLEDKLNGICRIGKTKTKEGFRQKQQVSYLPFKVDVTTIPVDNHTYIERFVHKLLDQHRTRGDWFAITREVFIDAVNSAKDNLIIDLERSIEYQRKHENSSFRGKILSNEIIKDLYRCEYCDFSNYNKSMWDVHELTCPNSPKGKDACIGCNHCERVDKIVYRHYQNKNREPKEIKTNGFVCTKLDIKMFPRYVVSSRLLDSMPQGTFEGESLMPHECEHFKTEILVKLKSK